MSVLAGANSTVQTVAFQFGRQLGMTFQLVDDMLDFVSTSAQLGKPAAADLRLGLATAPVLFAAQKVYRSIWFSLMLFKISNFYNNYTFSFSFLNLISSF